MSLPSDRVELGRFGRPHGIRGAVHFFAHNESSALLKAGRTIQVGARPEETRAFEVVEIRRDATGFVVQLKGISDRDAAGSLNGMMWYEARADFPPAGPDEYYHVDLIGLTARLEDGEVLGRVAEVWEMPANDVLVIRGVREHLVPFVEAFLVKVDLPGGEVVLRDVPGLRDPAPDEKA